MFKKNVYYYLILLCLFPGSLYAVPPTIQDIVNEVQQAQNLVTSVKSKLTILNDVSTATLTASALLPALDSENNFVYTKPDNIIMSSYKAVGYLHTTTTVKVNYDKMHTSLEYGKNIKELDTKTSDWLINLLTIKENFSDILSNSDIVVDDAYFKDSDTIYVLKITPTGMLGRRLNSKTVYIHVNHTKQRIEKITGQMFIDPNNNEEFVMTIDYISASDVILKVEFPFINIILKYEFYDISLNNGPPSIAATKTLSLNNPPTAIEISVFEKLNNDIEKICIAVTGEANAYEMASSATTGQLGSLSAIIKKFVPEICAILKDKTKNALFREVTAMETMLLSDDSRIRAALQDVLMDSSEDVLVRRACAQALGMKGEAESLDTVLAAWDSLCKNCPDVKTLLIILSDCLGSVGNNAAVEKRYQEMAQAEYYKNLGADFNLIKKINQLTTQDEARVNQRLTAGLSNAFWEVRQVSARSMGRRMRPEFIAKLITAFETEKSISYKEQAYPTLTEQHEIVMMQILESLSEIGDSTVVSKLLEWLGNSSISDDTNVKLKIIETLGNLKASPAYSVLLSILNEQDELIVIFAGRALAKIGNTGAITLMENRLTGLKDKYSIEHFKLSLKILRGW